MSSSLSNIAAKDGTGATVSGGILAVDKSGAGTGPFFAAQTIVDTQGVNTAAVKAASVAPAAGDPALVVAISPNGINVNGQAAMANSAPVVIASDQSKLPTNLAQVGGSTLAFGQAVMATSVPVVIASNQSNLPTNLAQVGGVSVALGQAVMATSLPVVMASNQAGFPVFPSATTAGGATGTSFLMGASTNTTSVKATAGQLYKVEVTNNGATIAYLKLYNSTVAPTAGSGTPAIRLMVPGNSLGAGIVSAYDFGVPFSNGIGFAFTGGIADNDTTAVSASTYIVNLYYA
jgi:hypothetical protein